MGRKYQIRDSEKLYFVTFTVVDWIEIFNHDEYREVFVESVKYCQAKKGLEVYAWCIMTNHIHMIISSSGEMLLPEIIRDLKSYTSRAIRKMLEKSLTDSRKNRILAAFKETGKKNKRNYDFQLWQQHSHPIELSSNEMMDQRLDYVHYNPVKAGFVDSPEDWLWSSAMDYYGVGRGKLDLLYIL